MFAYIKGTLEYKQNDHIVVEANGIGYKIFTSMSTVGALSQDEKEVKIYTYFYVREDIMSLYGFRTREELGIFELLISVSGVGPKAAISILSSIAPSKFGVAVITDDVKALTKAQGVGNKVAQRIILELKDKLKKEQITSAVDFNEKGSITNEGSRVSEAVSALMVLGYSVQEANVAVARVYVDGMELEEIIKGALKGLFK